MILGVGRKPQSSTPIMPAILGSRPFSSLLGLFVAGGTLACLWHWFVVANRYHVFLYLHIDAPWQGPAQPFDAITSTRYWMAPLVAAGVNSLLLIAVGTWIGHASRWRGVALPGLSPRAAWLPGALFLLVAVPVIVCTQSWPTLPLGQAAAVTLSALIGLVLALLPLDLAVSDPRRLCWLAADGLGLVPILLFWRAVELPELGKMPVALAVMVATASVGVSVAWLEGMTRLGHRQYRHLPELGPMLVAAAWWVLLFVPVVHHLIFTPAEYRYITSAQNLMGYSIATALTALTIAIAAAWWCCGRRGAGRRRIIPHDVQR